MVKGVVPPTDARVALATIAQDGLREIDRNQKAVRPVPGQAICSQWAARLNAPLGHDTWCLYFYMLKRDAQARLGK